MENHHKSLICKTMLLLWKMLRYYASYQHNYLAHNTLKIDIGNTKGKTLIVIVLQVYDEFKKAVDEFMTVHCEIMNIEERRFDDDFYIFR